MRKNGSKKNGGVKRAGEIVVSLQISRDGQEIEKVFLGKKIRKPEKEDCKAIWGSGRKEVVEKKKQVFEGV